MNRRFLPKSGLFAGVLSLVTGLTASLWGVEATGSAEQGAQARVTMEEQLKAVATHAEVVRYAEARKKLAADPYRPGYHFVTPDGMLNDPNGLCQWQGKYHLFYQLRPANGVFHWGHAYSDDLVHWKDLPLAIGPTIEKQVYSGQTLVEKDRVIAMYHGTKSGNFVATSDDPLLLTWKKLPGNPVIPLAQKDKEGRDIRIFDPDIWKEADGYYSLSGTYDEGTRGPGKDAKMVQYLFRSEDLKKWDYVGPMVEGREWTDPGEDGAVPKLLPIGNGKHILFFFSHARAAQYLVGAYDQATHRFTPESHGRFNFGPWLKGSLHAPGAFIDDAGRMIAIFNMRENMVSAAQPERGIAANEWYGMMTLPRQLWLDDKNALRMKPVPELEAIRGERVKVEARDIPANETVVLEGVAGKELEIDATFSGGSAREYGLEVLRSPDGREKTVITVYKDAGGEGIHQVGIDVGEASLRSDVAARPPEIAPAAVGKNVPVRLRVFVDRSIVEVFVNDVQALAVRVYPQEAQSRGVAVFSRGGGTKLESLEAWTMKSVFP